ncbi:MAG: hypothetical protein QOI21_2820 [Actinomycetota bacterium]|jgi:hypothetical protein|nr:hypothetical protein [Actinomycetota bacterium]
MRMVFTGADPEEFAEAAQRVLAEFEAWSETRERAVHLFVVDAVLNQRFESDGLVGRWNAPALRSLLLIWFPRRVTLAEPEHATVLETLEAFLDFLDDSDLLDERSDPITELRDILRELSPEFFTAMRRPENYGMAKFWATKMLESDVDPEDQDAASAFIDQVRAGRIPVDDGVLAVIAERHQEGDPDIPPQAPSAVFDLPPEDVQRELAAGTTIVTRLRDFVDWIGEGRVLTSKGNLKLADARELVTLLGTRDEFDQDIGGRVFHTRSSEQLIGVSGIFELAKAIRIARVAKGRLLKVKSAAKLLADPLKLWEVAFDRMDLLEAPLYSLYPVEDDMVFPILAGLFTSPIPLPAPILLTMLQETSLNPVTDSSLDREGKLLADFGLLELREATGDELIDLEEFMLEESLRVNNFTRQIFALLPMGQRAVRDLFAGSGASVTTVDELVGETAEVLVARLAEMAQETFDKGVAGWLGARSTTQACAELRALAARTDDSGHRMVALRLLSNCGEEGIAAMLDLRNHSMAGPAAAGWLVSAGVLAGDDLSRREVVFGMLDALAAVPDETVAEFALQSREAQLELLEEIPSAGHPRAAKVLESIAAGHEDQVVANAARNALVRLSTRP